MTVVSWEWERRSIIVLIRLIQIATLPIYALTKPLMILEESKVTVQINGQTCPECGSTIDGVTRKSLTQCGVRLARKAGTQVAWDRLPCWSITCPICRTVVCFDKRIKITSCEIGDHLSASETSQI